MYVHTYVATVYFSSFKILYLKLLWYNIATVSKSQLKGIRSNFMMPGGFDMSLRNNFTSHGSEMIHTVKRTPVGTYSLGHTHRGHTQSDIYRVT